MSKIPVLPHRDGIFEEVRYAHFLQAIGISDAPVAMKILSLGACNYSCPWCKRGGNRKVGGVIRGSEWVEVGSIAMKAKQHIERGYAIRFSGGDPCCFPKTVKLLAKLIKKAGGTVSVAHNGSSSEFVQELLDYVDFWAVDLKSIDSERFKVLTGTGRKSERYFNNTLQSIRLILWYDIPLEVRTTVFWYTSEDELDRIAEFLVSCDSPNLFWTVRLYDGPDTGRYKPPLLEEIATKLKKVRLKYPQLKLGIRSKWETNKGLILI